MGVLVYPPPPFLLVPGVSSALILLDDDGTDTEDVIADRSGRVSAVSRSISPTCCTGGFPLSPK